MNKTSAPAVSRRLLLLIALLAIDFVFMGLHVVHKVTNLLPDPRFAISQDDGFSEQFEYVEYLAIIAGLIYLCRIGFSWVYAAWAIIFSYLLADDSLTIHEIAGRVVSVQFGLPSAFGLRPEDLGEILVSGLAGGVFTLMLAGAHLVSPPPQRRANLILLALLVALAFFGVVVDALHVLAGADSLLLKGAVGVIEDGGEMVVMSVNVYVVLGMCVQRRAQVDGAAPGVAPR